MYNIACKIKSWWTSWIQSLNQIFVCNALFMYLHSSLYVLGHGWGPYGEVLWRLSLTAPPSPLPSLPPPLTPGSWAPCWKPLKLTSVTCSRYRGWGRSGSKAGDGSKTVWRSWCYSDCLVLLCGEGLWSSCVGKLGRERPGNKTMWYYSDCLVILCWSVSGLLPLSSSQLSLHPPLVGGGGSPVLGKAVPLQDTPTVFPNHTHPDTPPSSIIPEYVEGTCHLSPRGKIQVLILSGKNFTS